MNWKEATQEFSALQNRLDSCKTAEQAESIKKRLVELGLRYNFDWIIRRDIAILIRNELFGSDPPSDRPKTIDKEC